LKFGRYQSFSLSLEDRDGVPARSLHFEQRLFQHLPWARLRAPKNFADIASDVHVLATFLPAVVDLSRRPLSSWIHVSDLDTFVQSNTWMQALRNTGLQVVWIKKKLVP
jgi:hypothetical protein